MDKQVEIVLGTEVYDNGDESYEGENLSLHNEKMNKPKPLIYQAKSPAEKKQISPRNEIVPTFVDESDFYFDNDKD